MRNYLMNRNEQVLAKLDLQAKSSLWPVFLIKFYWNTVTPTCSLLSMAALAIKTKVEC